MFNSLTAASKAQHDQLDALISEAEAAGNTVDGMLTENPEGNTARFVLVIGDSPQTGTEYDRIYSFEGEEIARAGESAEFAVRALVESLGGALAGLGEPTTDLAI